MKTKLLSVGLLTMALTFSVITVHADEGKAKSPKFENKTQKEAKPKKARRKADVGNLVALKHQGRTIYVNEQSVQAHLDHGDILIDGAGAQGDKKDEKKSPAHPEKGPKEDKSK